MGGDLNIVVIIMQTSINTGTTHISAGNSTVCKMLKTFGTQRSRMYVPQLREKFQNAIFVIL